MFLIILQRFANLSSRHALPPRLLRSCGTEIEPTPLLHLILPFIADPNKDTTIVNEHVRCKHGWGYGYLTQQDSYSWLV